jgi:hypothetical protein
MTRVLATFTTALFIAVHLILAAAFGGFFMFAYPIFLLAAFVDEAARFALRLCR